MSLSLTPNEQAGMYQACTCMDYRIDALREPDCPIHGEQPETTLTVALTIPSKADFQFNEEGTSYDEWYEVHTLSSGEPDIECIHLTDKAKTAINDYITTTLTQYNQALHPDGETFEHMLTAIMIMFKDANDAPDEDERTREAFDYANSWLTGAFKQHDEEAGDDK